MKVSIITPVYNRISTISRCLDSVHSQSYKNIEHVIVDGCSTDGTYQLLKARLRSSDLLIHEADRGVYDALNKGMRNCAGDIICILHSDDYFVDSTVIQDIVSGFEGGCDILYSDLNYINKNNVVVRYWRSGKFIKEKLLFGWMPPHPTFIISRYVFDVIGFYDHSYSISADYDYTIRCMLNKNFKINYLNRVTIHMQIGGMSNGSFLKLLTKIKEDFIILKNNNLPPFQATFLKRLLKAGQFFNKHLP